MFDTQNNQYVPERLQQQYQGGQALGGGVQAVQSGTPIVNALSECESILITAFSDFDRLEKALSPVLLSRPPSNQSDPAAGGTANESPVLSKIRDIMRGESALVNRICDLISRIQA